MRMLRLLYSTSKSKQNLPRLAGSSRAVVRNGISFVQAGFFTARRSPLYQSSRPVLSW